MRARAGLCQPRNLGGPSISPQTYYTQSTEPPPTSTVGSLPSSSPCAPIRQGDKCYSNCAHGYATFECAFVPSVGERDGGGGEDRQREEVAVSVLQCVCARVCVSHCCDIWPRAHFIWILRTSITLNGPCSAGRAPVHLPDQQGCTSMRVHLKAAWAGWRTGTGRGWRRRH